MGDRAERNHVAVLAADIEVEQILGIQPEFRIRLDIDLQRQAEFVELVDIGRADIIGERRENVADADAQGLGAVAVDRQRDCGRVVAERRQHVLQGGSFAASATIWSVRLPSFWKSVLPPSSSTCIWKPPALPMPWIAGGGST